MKRRAKNYIVKSSWQKNISGDMSGSAPMYIWRTKIETPWNLNISEALVREVIVKDIEERKFLMFDGSFDKNFPLCKNFITGRWELTLSTDNEITGVSGYPDRIIVEPDAKDG